MKDEQADLLLMTMKHAGAKRRLRDRLERAQRAMEEAGSALAAGEEAPSEVSTVKTDGFPATEDVETLDPSGDGGQSPAGGAAGGGSGD